MDEMHILTKFVRSTSRKRRKFYSRRSTNLGAHSKELSDRLIILTLLSMPSFFDLLFQVSIYECHLHHLLRQAQGKCQGVPFAPKLKSNKKA